MRVPAALCLALLAAIGCSHRDQDGANAQPAPKDGAVAASPSVVSIDLTADRGLACLRPMGRRVGDMVDYEGTKFRVVLQLPGKTPLDIDAVHVTARVKSETIATIRITTDTHSAEESYRTAKDLATRWGLDRTKIESWYEVVKANPLTDDPLEVMRNDVSPSLTLVIRRLEMGERPWAIMLSVLFGP